MDWAVEGVLATLWVLGSRTVSPWCCMFLCQLSLSNNVSLVWHQQGPLLLRIFPLWFCCFTTAKSQWYLGRFSQPAVAAWCIWKSCISRRHTCKWGLWSPTRSLWSLNSSGVPNPEKDGPQPPLTDSILNCILDPRGWFSLISCDCQSQAIDWWRGTSMAPHTRKRLFFYPT